MIPQLSESPTIGKGNIKMMRSKNEINMKRDVANTKWLSKNRAMTKFIFLVMGTNKIEDIPECRFDSE